MNQEFKIIAFEDAKGSEPFTEWILSLASAIQKRIFARLARLQVGNFGDCKQISENLYELRCFFGPGYRIYFSKLKKRIIVLLCGGDKNTQTKDIKKAAQYWKEFNNN